MVRIGKSSAIGLLDWFQSTAEIRPIGRFDPDRSYDRIGTANIPRKNLFQVGAGMLLPAD